MVPSLVVTCDRTDEDRRRRYAPRRARSSVCDHLAIIGEGIGCTGAAGARGAGAAGVRGLRPCHPRRPLRPHPPVPEAVFG